MARNSGFSWGRVLMTLAVVVALALAGALAIVVFDINLIPPPDDTSQYE